MINFHNFSVGSTFCILCNQFLPRIALQWLPNGSRSHSGWERSSKQAMYTLPGMLLLVIHDRMICAPLHAHSSIEAPRTLGLQAASTTRENEYCRSGISLLTSVHEYRWVLCVSCVTVLVARPHLLHTCVCRKLTANLPAWHYAWGKSIQAWG